MQEELTLPLKDEQVLLLIDWDNVWYSLMTRFGIASMDLEGRLKRLMEWLPKNAGKLIGGKGFLFAPEHLSPIQRQNCVDLGLTLITCPKRDLQEAKLNKKSGKMEMQQDTVDETIIWFAKTMAGHPNFNTLCLATGDKDYVPLLDEMKKQNIKIALAPPSLASLARDKELIKRVDLSPITGKIMLFRLDEF